MTSSQDNVVSHAKVRSLRDAMTKVRTAETDRSDGAEELLEAERARLEMLAEELSDIFDEAAKDDYFIFQLAPSRPPRLWIDITSHVALGRDRRTFRFLKDTRLGRAVIKETNDQGIMADTVTDYIAERIVERQRMLETEWVSEKLQSEKAPQRQKDKKKSRGIGRALFIFLLGLAAGAAGLVGYAWFYNPL